MRIRVDPDKCIGSGACEVLAPDVFAVSDDGLCQVLVADDDSDAGSRVLKAVESCPTRAISVRQVQPEAAREGSKRPVI